MYIVYFALTACLFSGDERWPPGCHLKFCAGENLSLSDRTIVEALEPGQVTDVAVEMHSRRDPGVYQSQWRMSTATGMFFGGNLHSQFQIIGIIWR